MVVLQKDGAVTVIWIVAMNDYTSAAGFARTYQGSWGDCASGGAPARITWSAAAPRCWRLSDRAPHKRPH